MNPRKKALYLTLVIAVLAGMALACGTGYQTSSKILGNSGEVRVKMKDASGANSTSLEINEDWYRERVAASVTLSVDTGRCRAVLSGEDSTLLVLDAAAGSPSEAFGELVTDSFGEVSLQTDCQEAQNLELTITFQR